LISVSTRVHDSRSLRFWRESTLWVRRNETEVLS